MRSTGDNPEANPCLGLASGVPILQPPLQAANGAETVARVDFDLYPLFPLSSFWICIGITALLVENLPAIGGCSISDRSDCPSHNQKEVL
jgi:hypothetical protein